MEVSVDAENESMEVNISSGESSMHPQPKKAKFLEDLNIVHESLSSSPDLPHKLPVRSHHQESEVSEEVIENSEDLKEIQDGEKSNLFGVKYIMWFEIGIEGKNPMDQDEEDRGGKIEFGFMDKKFSKELEDYFILFEDECTQSHACAGRVMGVASGMREKLIEPPSFDPRNIVDLVEKYGESKVST